MSDKDIFAEREHWLEEEYFRRKNQELIEKIHQQQARQAARQQMAETIGVADQEVIEALEDLGYTDETVQLLHLVPLVQVAWSEGGVADRERKMIFKVAESRGIKPGSLAHQKLTLWLTEKPSELFFENNLHAIRIVFELLPPEQREASRRSLITYCTQIASIVEGGIMGRAQLSEEERLLIAHIAMEIGQGREAAVKRVIER
ncbi:MAG: hypothetical protein MOB07_19695 [Acidobacteria bacterium]|nr:hypothetical protein [Acidobacteriota bacterium]